MEFNINKVSDDMLTVIKDVVGNHWKEIQSTAQQFMKSNKDRLKMIAGLRISGELNQEDFESRLEDQMKVIEAQLEALKVLTKAMIQKAANAAIDVFTKAVKVAIGV